MDHSPACTVTRDVTAPSRTPSFRRGLGRALAAARRHRLPLSLGAAALAGVAALAAGGLTLSTATARADAPAPSQGRVLRVVLDTRPAPVAEPANYSLLATLSGDTPQALPVDPGLASAQSSAEVQAYLDREAREQRAVLMALRRADLAAERTLSEAPDWSRDAPPAPSADPAQPAADPGA